MSMPEMESRRLCKIYCAFKQDLFRSGWRYDYSSGAKGNSVYFAEGISAEGFWISIIGSKSCTIWGTTFETFADFIYSWSGLWRISCNSSAKIYIFLLPTASMCAYSALWYTSDCYCSAIFCLAFAFSFFIWWISLNSRFSFLSVGLAYGYGSFFVSFLLVGRSSMTVFRLFLESSMGRGMSCR